LLVSKKLFIGFLDTLGAEAEVTGALHPMIIKKITKMLLEPFICTFRASTRGSAAKGTTTDVWELLGASPISSISNFDSLKKLEHGDWRMT